MTRGPTSAVTPGNETTYDYDPAGNMTGSEADGLTAFLNSRDPRPQPPLPASADL